MLEEHSWSSVEHDQSIQRNPEIFGHNLGQKIADEFYASYFYDFDAHMSKLFFSYTKRLSIHNLTEAFHRLS